MKTTVQILRFNPAVDREPKLETFPYDLKLGMTVLDVLNYVHDNLDSTLAYSYCCRNGHCGLCAMNVNGKPALACRRAAEADMKLEPLRHFTVLRDLVIDRSDYERLRPKLRLFLERDTPCTDEPETIDMEQYEHFKVASRCIECYACVSACPVYHRDPHGFIGPAALVLEARHFFDCRDTQNRRLILESEGIAACIQCGLCSKACSVDAQPCETIGRMQKLISK